MNIIELVSFFRDSGTFYEFCQNESIDTNSETIEIFSRNPKDISAQIIFLPIEETEGKNILKIDNVTYYNLFDFFYFLDVIKDAKTQKSISNIELSKILIKYSENDS